MVKTDQAQIDRIVARTVRTPVRASVTGQPSIDRAMKTRAVHDAPARRRAGAPAAVPRPAAPAARPRRGLRRSRSLAAATAFSGLGLTALLGKVQDVDALDVTVGTMAGLALGVAYGLFMSPPLALRAAGRHRRPRRRPRGRDGRQHDRAAPSSSAAPALIAALIVADLVGPTTVLSSLGVTAVLCATLAIGAAVVVVPAALVLLGRRALAFSFGAPGPLVRGLGPAVVGRQLGHPRRRPGRRGRDRPARAPGDPAAVDQDRAALGEVPPEGRRRTRRPTSASRTSWAPGWPTPYNIVVRLQDPADHRQRPARPGRHVPDAAGQGPAHRLGRRARARSPPRARTSARCPRR